MDGNVDESLVIDSDTLDVWFVNDELKSQDKALRGLDSFAVGIQYRNDGSVELHTLSETEYQAQEEYTATLPAGFEVGIS